MLAIVNPAGATFTAAGPLPETMAYGKVPSREELVIAWAAVAELGSTHPLAKPIVAASHSPSVLPQPDVVENLPGKGVVATLNEQRIAVGNRSLMRSLEIAVAPEAEGLLAGLREQAVTPVFVALDGALIGILGVADEARLDASEVMGRISRKMPVVMLTGDDEPTALAIAAQVGVERVHAGLLPDDKLAAVRTFRESGHIVAMLGDGVNDAPALAAADIGIAMGAAGSDVAIETADVALLTDDLSKLEEMIRISRATLANIRQNVAIAVITVIGLVIGVLLGEVHMAGGMLVHEASVLLVIANALRLNR